MNRLYDNAFYFISGHGRGWAFSANDLLEKFSRQQADMDILKSLWDNELISKKNISI